MHKSNILIVVAMLMILTLGTILSKPMEKDATGSTCTFFNWTKCKKQNKNTVKYLFFNQCMSSSIVRAYVLNVHTKYALLEN